MKPKSLEPRDLPNQRSKIVAKRFGIENEHAADYRTDNADHSAICAKFAKNAQLQV